jgi:hypothetical protein
MLRRIQETTCGLKPLAVEAAVSSHAFQASFTLPCITQRGSNYNQLAGAISIIRTTVAERCVQLRLNPNLIMLPFHNYSGLLNRLKEVGITACLLATRIITK